MYERQTEVLPINSLTPDPSIIERAAQLLRNGELVVFPTETVYGLGADALQPSAVEQIFMAKERPFSDPLIVHIAALETLETLVTEVPLQALQLAQAFWPGPLTIIVKADPKLPLKVTANTGNVALRVPSAEIPLAILRAVGSPITATSANLHGASECTNALEVRDQLGDCLPLIVDGGQSPRDMPSTIVDLTSEDGAWRLLREGAIPSDQIVELLGQE